MPTKKLEDITRAEWIAFFWLEDSDFESSGRFFTRGQRRTPDEAAQAAENWDYTAEERSIADDEGQGNDSES
jgi:hypothetical protein